MLDPRNMASKGKQHGMNVCGNAQRIGHIFWKGGVEADSEPQNGVPFSMSTLRAISTFSNIKEWYQSVNVLSSCFCSA